LWWRKRRLTVFIYCRIHRESYLKEKTQKKVDKQEKQAKTSLPKSVGTLRKHVTQRQSHRRVKSASMYED